jgi:hypothetical protein
MLHLNSNKKEMPSGQPGYNTLYKIHPITNTLTTNLKDTYRPEETHF